MLLRGELSFCQYRFIIGIVFLFLNFGVRSQNLDEMGFELLDEKDGLSNIFITHMTLDSMGFVWIGTVNGLNRYDGNSFKVFRHNEKDSTSLLHDAAQYLYVDQKRRIWVAYREGGLSLFDENCQCFKHFTIPDKIKKPGFFACTTIHYVDSSDLIWVGGLETGLSSFNPSTGKLVTYDLPESNTSHYKTYEVKINTVNRLYVASNGIFWVCTDNGLYSFDRATGLFDHKTYALNKPKISYDDYFFDLYPDGTKGFWLAAYGGGLSYYEISSGKFTNYKYNLKDFTEFLGNTISSIAKKSETEIWITTGDRGLGVFNTKNNQFKFLDSNTLVPGEFNRFGIEDCLATPDHFIFLSCAEGLLKFNPYSSLFNFHSLDIPNRLGVDFRITKIIEDTAFHSIYFATDYGNGFNILDTKTNKLGSLTVDINPFVKEKYMHVLDMLLDRNGRLWVVSADYLYEYDKIRNKLIKVQNPFSFNDIKEQITYKSISEDKDGSIWILIEQGGLYKFMPEEYKFSDQLNLKSLDSNSLEHPEKLVFDNQGKIWLYEDKSICIYDKAVKKFIRPLPPDINHLIENRISGMTADKTGTIWVAIDKVGLLKIGLQNSEMYTYQKITPEDGLPTNRIYNINTDPYGNIWLTTVRGVVYMNTTTNQFRIFNQTVGMSKRYTNIKYLNAGSNAFYVTSNGRYSRVNFEALDKLAPSPKVYFDKFRIFNIEKFGQFNKNTTITLKPGEDFFSFDFGCIDYTNQSQNKFAYMLDGWDKDWIQSDSRRYASYTNLNGGNYVFKVKVANNEGVWGSPISVPILILIPFYKKTGFIILLALFFVAMIFSLYQYRIRQIEQTEHLKTEFNRQLSETRMEALRAQMNPHFIFNCLNSINRYIIKSDIKTSSLYITRFAKLIRLILDNSEHKKVVLSNELEALKLYIEMESLRFDHKFTFEIQIDEEVDTNNIEVPPLIIQPYVENAIWHGLLQKDSGGNLLVHVSRQNDNLICEITDNGIGREKAMEYKSKNAPTRKSIGMKLTEERLNMASEDLANSGSQKIIDLYDDKGEAMGTTVIITIPI